MAGGGDEMVCKVPSNQAILWFWYPNIHNLHGESALLHNCIKIARGVLVVYPLPCGVGTLGEPLPSEGRWEMSKSGAAAANVLPGLQRNLLDHNIALEQDYPGY